MSDGNEQPKMKMKLKDALKYLASKHGINVSKMTFYNWVNRGVAGVTLKVSYCAGVMLTTEADLDAWAGHRTANLDPRYVR